MRAVPGLGPSGGPVAAVLRPVAVAVAAVLVLGLAVPAAFGVAWLSVWTSCAIFAVAAAGVGLLHGWLGLTSLTQVGLVGVGGWITLRLAFATEWPFVVQVALAGLLTGGLGLLLALPALRLRGLYLALVTLMVAAGLDVVFNATGFPNGGGGVLGYQSTGALQRLERPRFAGSDAGYFRLVLAVAAVAILVVLAQLRGRAGRTWALIARSEAAATSAGVSLSLSQIWAFGLAGVLAGLAGGLLAGQLGQLGPSTFQISESMLLFALVVVAGAHHWAGWILAAVLYKVVPFALSEAGVDGSVATILFGVALMGSMLGSPHGVVGAAEQALVTRRIRRDHEEVLA
ncbi:ABC-type branched-chain amino acid transport system permease component [Patulibacter medicamentivorans]|uniref:ABC-type branched-chain amino acid transport system permease component n=1 Tax=Patulibacter medicamentivorans TaxID=1097667 RepID=H0E819_9ACTN|nr:ABC-type branched-chain amino acid transport system permease component [Patulibacter medicamentivorans]EHN10217.1 ABC-type branched-chain amino acid transport system permease component [Patulibacter medicamentivorans]